MSKKKYILHPDRVVSKNDLSDHYVDARTLANLYGVSMSECLVYNWRYSDRHGISAEDWESLTHLCVDPSGNYTLPEVKSNDQHR